MANNQVAANSNVILHSAFNPESLYYPPTVTFNKSGGKSVPITYGPSNQKLTLQTPTMQTPFGISKYVDKSGKASWSLDLSFKDMDRDPKLLAFYNNMLRMDEITLDKTVENSKAWMDKEMPKMIVSEFYARCVKPESKSKKTDAVYPPSLKIKLPPVPTPDAVPEVKVYNEQRQEVPVEYVTSHSAVKAIIELKSIYFIGKSSFGVTWRLQQVQVISRPQKLQGFAFKNEDGEDEAFMED